ncbi:MAG: hypothetical protein KF764_13220 [Labilithrix sp.]|nr:hypothetical protein [Labilithrix sp.]
MGKVAFARIGLGVACAVAWVAACSSDSAGPDGMSSSGSVAADASDERDRATGGDAAASSDGSGDGASSDGAPEEVDAGPPAVQLIGRFDARQAAGPKCAWAGCRILARFEGTQVSVDLEEIDETWMEGAPSEWDVAVDDVWKPKIVTTPGKRTYSIATGLAAGPHKVELYKRSEPQNGVTRFVGFDFGGGALLAPPPRATRRIEIVGDSAASGFGVEGVGYPDNDCPGVDYGASWQNFRKSFGALLGTTLGAEVHGTAYSGKGLVKNIWRPDTAAMPYLFSLANPIDFSSTYDFAWKPDVVVVMIGGNDFALGQPDETAGNGPATAAEFLAAYRTFVGTLRTTYPDAHLILTVSPSVSDSDPPGRSTRTNIANATTTVAAERTAASDARVHAFAPNVATPSELTACNGHGTPALHTRVAGELAVFVKKTTGW